MGRGRATVVQDKQRRDGTDWLQKLLNALNSTYDDNQTLRSNSGSLKIISEQNKHFCCILTDKLYNFYIRSFELKKKTKKKTFVVKIT